MSAATSGGRPSNTRISDAHAGYVLLSSSCPGLTRASIEKQTAGRKPGRLGSALPALSFCRRFFRWFIVGTIARDALPTRFRTFLNVASGDMKLSLHDCAIVTGLAIGTPIVRLIAIRDSGIRLTGYFIARDLLGSPYLFRPRCQDSHAMKEHVILFFRHLNDTVASGVESLPSDFIDALVAGLAPDEREGRLLMVIQTGYFDDSGSDAGSEYYVLAGFVAPVSDWKAFSAKWRVTLDKEPSIRYFKMSEAMAMDGLFKNGWTVPLRDQRIFELAEIIEELDPARIECFLKRSDFDNFVSGILPGRTFSDPYFMCFYHMILSIAANAASIPWNKDCDFIFDDQGSLGKNAVERWDWVKENVEAPVNAKDLLGSPPIFRDDVKFLPLQAADMFAWLFRDCITYGSNHIGDIARATLKRIEGRKILRVPISKEELMRLGATFLVQQAKLDGRLPPLR
jgi:hypothetical protein